MIEQQQAALARLDLATLAGLYEEAKATESNAIDYRRHIGEEIAARLPAPEVIPATRSARDGAYAVTVRYDNRVKLNNNDANALSTALDAPAIYGNLVKSTHEVSSSYLKYLRSNEPEVFERIAPFLTSRPGSPQITIKPIKPGN